MSIHSDHPFATPEPERDPVRRLRGRLPSPVTVWTTGRGAGAQGWTVASMLVAEGDPAGGDRAPTVLGLLDEDSELADALGDGSRVCVSLLAHEHRAVADAFARVAPSPGGPFRTGDWLDTDWGPRLAGAVGWLGVRLTGEPSPAGWPLLVRGALEHAEVGEGEPMAYVRGRYRDLSEGPHRLGS